MASLTFNKTKLSTDYLSNISQVSQSTCSIDTSATLSGTVVIGTGLTVTGDYTAGQLSTTTDSTCVLATTMAETIQNISLSQMNQTNNNDGTILNGLKYLGVQRNKFVSSTDFTSNMSQINQSTCTISTVASANNNYTYLSNSKVGGNYMGFSNTSNSNGTCGITNQMKAITYNNSTQDGNQDNVQTGMFVAIAGIFAGIIGVVIFIVIILFAVGALGYAGYSVTGKKKTPPGTTGATGAAALSPDDLELANELGISPDVLASGLGPEPLPTSLPVEPPPMVVTTTPPAEPPPAPVAPPAAAAKPSSSWSDIAASALTSLQKSSAYNSLQAPPASSSSLSQTLNALINSKPPA